MGCVSGAPVYEALVTPHLKDLRQYCSYLTRSSWDGEDLCQEALLKSFHYFLKTGTIHDTKSFLFRMARNLWIDEYRRKKRRQIILGIERDIRSSDKDYAEISCLVEWLAERLPERYMDMWLLSEYFGYTMQEIAEEMGCSVSAVKSVLHRARLLLRKTRDETITNEPNGKAVRLEAERWVLAVIHDRPRHAAAVSDRS
jgi:RNA polymerase sigma-70 factor (ECF subfamily)